MKRSSFLLGASAIGIVARAGIRTVRASEMPALTVMLGRGEALRVDAATFTFNGNRFRGTFVNRPDGRIVTNVPLEEYLYSVVPAEMPHAWPPSALQAQAICARSYAIKQMSAKGFDALDASEAGQVYRGIDAETTATTLATNATVGQVLRFANQPATIAYSSCCGGHTESASAAWGGSGLPYLEGIVCTYCGDSPNYTWSANVLRTAMEAAFSSQLGTGGRVDSIRIDSSDPSGRAATISLQGQGGDVVIAGKAFRAALGTRVIRSLLLREIAPAADGFRIDGRGLGHGVGLCQWGARGYALTGATASRILALYFPGTYVATNY